MQTRKSTSENRLGIWKSVDEYVDFAIKHQAFGNDAKKLRLKQLKQIIPLPKIKLRLDTM